MSEHEGEPLETSGATVAPAGLGGWLLLPLLHVIVTPFFLISNVADSVQPTPVILFTLCVAAYGIYCLIRFLQLKRNAPVLMIVFYSLLIIVACVNYAVLRQMYPVERLGNAFTATVRNMIVPAIWIGYFLNSVRVKNSFVR